MLGFVVPQYDLASVLASAPSLTHCICWSKSSVKCLVLRGFRTFSAKDTRKINGETRSDSKGRAFESHRAYQRWKIRTSFPLGTGSDFCFSFKNANRFSIPEGMLVSCCDRRKWKRIINRLSKKSFARSAHQIKNCNKLQLLSFECRAAAISRIEGYGLIKTGSTRWIDAKRQEKVAWAMHLGLYTNDSELCP